MRARALDLPSGHSRNHLISSLHVVKRAVTVVSAQLVSNRWSRIGSWNDWSEITYEAPLNEMSLKPGASATISQPAGGNEISVKSLVAPCAQGLGSTLGVRTHKYAKIFFKNHTKWVITRTPTARVGIRPPPWTWCAEICPVNAIGQVTAKRCRE